MPHSTITKVKGAKTVNDVVTAFEAGGTTFGAFPFGLGSNPPDGHVIVMFSMACIDIVSDTAVLVLPPESAALFQEVVNKACNHHKV